MPSDALYPLTMLSVVCIQASVDDRRYLRLFYYLLY